MRTFEHISERPQAPLEARTGPAPTTVPFSLDHKQLQQAMWLTYHHYVLTAQVLAVLCRGCGVWDVPHAPLSGMNVQ